MMRAIAQLVPAALAAVCPPDWDAVNPIVLLCQPSSASPCSCEADSTYLPSQGNSQTDTPQGIVAFGIQEAQEMLRLGPFCSSSESFMRHPPYSCAPNS